MDQLDIRRRHDGRFNVYRALANAFSSMQWEVIATFATFKEALVFTQGEKQTWRSLLPVS